MGSERRGPGASEGGFVQKLPDHEVSNGKLRSGSRIHEIVETRRVFSWMAVEGLGYSGAEVARYLGVTTSCVTRAVSSGREPERENYF